MRRENLEIQKESLERQKADETLIRKYAEMADEYKLKVKKYDEEKEEITKVATGFETLRDESKLHSDKFGIAVIFLQISILLSSIATLSKKRFVWICGLVFGVVGLFFFLDGFFLLM